MARVALRLDLWHGLSMENELFGQNQKLLKIIVWASSLAVAGSLALLGGFPTYHSQESYQLGVGSLLAFVAGLAFMRWWWRKFFRLLSDARKMRRFLVGYGILFLTAFMAGVFLPQFSSAGVNKNETLTGMILGFAAVAAVFFLVRVVIRLFEAADAISESKE